MSQTHETTRLAATRASAQRIVVVDFRCEALIGVTDEERAVPQSLAIAVELDLVPDPPKHDEESEILSYGHVVRILRRVCSQSRYKLLETLADALADEIFAFEAVLASRIRVLKLDRYEDVAGIGIEIERNRTSNTT